MTEEQETSVDAFKRRLKQFRGDNLFIILMIMVGMIGVFAGVSGGRTLRPANIINVWLQISTRGIASMGQSLVMLTAGIDVSVGGSALLIAVITATLITGTSSFPAGQIAVGLLVGVGIGLFNGGMISRIGMPPLIITLPMWLILEGVSLVTTRGQTLRYFPETMAIIGQGRVGIVPVPLIIFLIVFGIVYYVLYHTRFGRAVYATGGNPVSAVLAGIDTRRTILIVYIISGFLAGLAGQITMSRVMSAGMNTVEGLELDTIAACAIGGISLMGGRGNLIGAFLGVLILGIIANGMNVSGVPAWYQDIVKGIIIIVAVSIDYLRRRES